MQYTIEWLGRSGMAYRYWLNDLTASYYAVGGNYCFVRQMTEGYFIPLYFGESSNLEERLRNHDVWPHAIRHGVTHLMSHSTPTGALARLAEERDLIEFWNPVLNVQHRTAG